MIKDYYIRSVELLADTIPDNSIYPFCLPAVKNLETIDFDEHVTFLV
jgi:predicted ATPase